VGEYTGQIPLPTVGIDNVQAAADATQHLVDLGHRDIAFIGGPKDFTLCQERLKGFKRVMRKAGLKVSAVQVQFGEFKLASGYEQVKRLIAGGSQPTALFCANDEIAMGAMKALREHKLRIPEDISIMGFDNLDIADYCTTPLTTIHQPRREMGRTAMELMLSLLQGRRWEGVPLLLGHELVVRDSTGPVVK
jgi:LacI family transcriptional regulator, repressor for deo operon, udp, cdd, tsx, nupC, and nupG